MYPIRIWKPCFAKSGWQVNFGYIEQRRNRARCHQHRRTQRRSEGLARLQRPFPYPLAAGQLSCPAGCYPLEPLRSGDGASAPCRRSERCERREAPAGAERKRHAPGGSCEAAGVGSNPELEAKKPMRKHRLWSGELGIRTPGTLQFNSFQDCRHRPLGQLS